MSLLSELSFLILPVCMALMASRYAPMMCVALSGALMFFAVIAHRVASGMRIRAKIKEALAEFVEENEPYLTPEELSTACLDQEEDMRKYFRFRIRTWGLVVWIADFLLVMCYVIVTFR